ncbi:MAG: HAD family hydrolase [Oscillospiraceae bacterium]|jgi:phosphoglycolate phosphatase/pyrophosphatase PpaX|nr:HAD family hydrolase [Oscillospiraceae bacterium]
MLKAVLFDLDGTLCDTLPLCIEAFRQSIAPLAGRPISDAEIVATFGPSEEGTILALIPEHYDRGVRDYLASYEALHARYPAPFDGIRSLLTDLKHRGFLLALVTGKGRQSCRISLRHLDLESVFDMVETGSPTGVRKTEGMLAVLTRFALRPDEAVYVGDTAHDVLSARRAGIPALSALWSSLLQEADVLAAKPDRVFYSVDALRAYLLSAPAGAGAERRVLSAEF